MEENKESEIHGKDKVVAVQCTVCIVLGFWEEFFQYQRRLSKVTCKIL